MSQIEILCTLGPASMNDRVIVRLEALGVSLFRINLSHTKLQDVQPVIDFIRSRTKIPICLDSEGAQIRTGAILGKETELKENSVVHVLKNTVVGDNQKLNFYPDEAVDLLEEGDFVSIDFNSVLAQVLKKDACGVQLRILNGGTIGSNKAVTVERDILLPTMTQKDVRAFEIGQRMQIRHFALSFANRGSDVDLVRSVLGPDAFLISKIECRNGLLHLDEIAVKSDALLIDRGDLSRQEPIERIPHLQKLIIHRAKHLKKKVYVATNLLESMTVSPKPTRAEVNDVINTLMDGADGLVLAAETAIGKDPIGCAGMIVKLIQEYELNRQKTDHAYHSSDIQSSLVEPHGGSLVNRKCSGDEAGEFKKYKRLKVAATDLMDCEQIASGAYSPLTGFMDTTTIRSVLEKDRLPNGLPWTLPVLLQIRQEDGRRIHKGERIILTDGKGADYALLEVSESSAFEAGPLMKKWFGTESKDHPGVMAIHQKGNWLLAGDVTLLGRLPSAYRYYQLTCAQSRFIFTHKGWSRVVGFHTRNVVHRAHEHIQLKALERTHADGLYISPLIGPCKKGDFLSDPVIKSYQMMIDRGFYPAGKVVLGCFATYPRFAGPREAVFTALCRKNMGCSHFIVGRNHSGIGDYYRDAEYRRLFESLPDLGIAPVFFDAIGYDAGKKKYVSADGGSQVEMISGSRVREALLQNEMLPDWYVREEIQQMLKAEFADKQSLFFR